MKDQATHIRLIRDDNGKPVEAEYLRTREIPSFLNAFQLLNAQRIRRNFTEWSIANRIPVIGDWPADKHVFALDEVEEVWQYRHAPGCDWLNSTLQQDFKITFEQYREDNSDREVRTALRLKATLSDDRQSEVTVKEGKNTGGFFGFGIAGDVVDSTVDQLLKELPEEQPKQKAKTADYWDLHARSVPEDFYDVSELDWVIGKRVMLEEDFFAAKQQYQQQLIEKLREERNYRSVPDQYVIDSIIEIIQSTK